MPARLDRAQRNFLETFAIFAAAVLIYLAGRLLFLPLYAAGTPWLRTLSWNAATLGLVMMMIAAVWRP